MLLILGAPRRAGGQPLALRRRAGLAVRAALGLEAAGRAADVVELLEQAPPSLRPAILRSAAARCRPRPVHRPDHRPAARRRPATRHRPEGGLAATLSLPLARSSGKAGRVRGNRSCRARARRPGVIIAAVVLGWCWAPAGRSGATKGAGARARSRSSRDASRGASSTWRTSGGRLRFRSPDAFLAGEASACRNLARCPIWSSCAPEPADPCPADVSGQPPAGRAGSARGWPACHRSDRNVLSTASGPFPS